MKLVRRVHTRVIVKREAAEDSLHKISYVIQECEETANLAHAIASSLCGDAAGSGVVRAESERFCGLAEGMRKGVELPLRRLTSDTTAQQNSGEEDLLHIVGDDCRDDQA